MPKEIKKPSSKKEIRNLIALKLEKALLKYKPLLGDKKFAGRIKKAAKLFGEGLETKKIVLKQKTVVVKQKLNKDGLKD